MFFAFCSDLEYPEDQWTAVWALEVAIQALLLDMDEEPFGTIKSSGDLADLLRYRIREYGFLPGIAAEGGASEWIDTFLDQQAEAIFVFVEETRKLAPGAARKRLMPLQTQLTNCLERSDSFRSRIIERGNRARVDMEMLGE